MLTLYTNFLGLITSIVLPFVQDQWKLLGGHLHRLYQHTSASHPSTKETTHHTTDSIRSLLSPPGASIRQLLEERAAANTHLAKALSLTNTFVRPDTQVHMEFVRRMRGLLRDVQASGWTTFHETCVRAVRHTLNEYIPPHLIPPPPVTHDQSIPFDQFIQIVVLRAILVSLLNVGRDVEDLEHRHLTSVTTSINNLWTLSKAGVVPPDHLSRELHDSLRLLVPQAEITNPIDFVVPTWETMWRVCAVTIARIREAEEYQDAFADFLHSGSSSEFETIREGGFSIKNFLEEVIRLHPPSKHISRSVLPHQTGILDRIRGWINIPVTPTRHVADIQSVLHSRTIWSDDADNFDPSRFQRLDSLSGGQQRSEALALVFGHGPTRCIAASWAPMAAAIISGTIVRECTEMEWEITAGSRIGGRQGWEGWRVVKL